MLLMLCSTRTRGDGFVTYVLTLHLALEPTRGKGLTSWGSRSPGHWLHFLPWMRGCVWLENCSFRVGQPSLMWEPLLVRVQSCRMLLLAQQSVQGSRGASTQAVSSYPARPWLCSEHQQELHMGLPTRDMPHHTVLPVSCCALPPHSQSVSVIGSWEPHLIYDLNVKQSKSRMKYCHTHQTVLVL